MPDSVIRRLSGDFPTSEPLEPRFFTFPPKCYERSIAFDGSSHQNAGWSKRPKVMNKFHARKGWRANYLATRNSLALN